MPLRHHAYSSWDTRNIGRFCVCENICGYCFFIISIVLLVIKIKHSPEIYHEHSLANHMMIVLSQSLMKRYQQRE